ncbi:hypothetical protein C6503_11980 [Candidatus Poribacteria bacterium]|nr:MAG: hypothetical protein C6503_11980 [Candidatus Poribacteria bacterium]
MLNTAIANLEENGHADAAALFPPVGKLKRVLRAQVNPDSDYITLAVELTEAEGGERNAALLVNQLAKDMQMLRRGDEETKLSKLMEFLENKQREIEAKIDKNLDDLLAFVRDHGSAEIWVPTLTNLLDQLARVRENLEINQQQLYATNTHITYLKEQLKNLPKQIPLSETTSHNPVWLFQQEKLFNLESQRVAAAKKVGTTSSDLEGLDAQIAEIQEKNEETPLLTTTVTSGTSAHYTYIQNQLVALVPNLSRYENAAKRLKEEEETLETELAKLVEQIPENQIILTQKGAEIQTTNAMAEEIAKRSLEAEILYAESKIPASRNQIGGIEIVDRATPRKIPVSPHLRFIFIIAGITGLILGVTVALFIEYFNRTAANLKT